MILIELTAAIDAAGTLRTFYLSDRRFTTKPTDTPANTVFTPSLLDPGSFTVSAFGDGRTGGKTTLAFGEIRAANAGALYDDWQDYGFDSRALVIRQGDEGGAYPADFPAIFTGTMETVTIDEGQLSIRVRDRQFIFDGNAMVATYAGDNALPAGVEGNADDLKGEPKPRLYGGPVREIPAPCVNTTLLAYQVHNGALASIAAVYAGGVAQTFQADFGTTAGLLAAAITAGSYSTCLSAGLFRLGSSPAGQVTCDATHGTNITDRNAAKLLEALALEAGVAFTDVSAADVADLSAANPAPLGIWLNSRATFAAIMDEVAKSVGAQYTFDAVGVLRMSRLEAPAGLPVLSLADLHALGGGPQRKPARGGDLPSWSFTVRHSRLYATQSNPMGSVNAVRRAYLASEWRAARAEDAAVKTKHPLAVESVIDSLFTSEADALTEATRRLLLFKTRADFYDVAIPAVLLTETPTRIMQSVGLTYDRFGMGDGRLFRLMGYRLELAKDQATVSLWGAPTVIPAVPALVTAPVVTGGALVGDLLTSTTGVFSGGPTAYAYQWKRDGVPIGGATSSAYTIVGGDLGATLTVTVTASNAYGSDTGTSNGTTVAAAPVNTVAPVISGSLPVGSTLTTTNGTWTGSPAPTFTYQWKRAGANIGGATAGTYVTVTADAGAAITCTVTGTNTGGAASATSNTITPISAPVNTVAPAVSGSANQGSTLSCTTGTWTGSPAPTYTYQWRRAGANIGGATSSTYVTVTADAGNAVDCVVTGTNTAGAASATATGAVTVIGVPANTVAPAITGTLHVGQVQTCTTGTWTNTPTSYTYQWKRSGVNIAAATASTYTLALADMVTPTAAALTCEVVATNGAGSSAAVASNSRTVTVTPQAIMPSKVVGWWTVNDLSTITLSGSNVSSWVDKISGYDLVQATGAVQPTYSATGWNGASPAISSDGSRYMRTASWPANFPTTTAYSETWWIADDQAVESDADPTRALFADGGTANGTFREVRRASVTSVSRLRASDGSALSTYTGISMFGRHYGQVLHDGTNMQGTLDGGTLSTATAHGSSGSTRASLFNTPAGTASGWSGAVREIVKLNAAPTAGEATALKDYLNNRV